ncbi:MAG: hypothetical protein ACRCWF_10250 [Beijerinckiaceae bacterium]
MAKRRAYAGILAYTRTLLWGGVFFLLVLLALPFVVHHKRVQQRDAAIDSLIALTEHHQALVRDPIKPASWDLGHTGFAKQQGRSFLLYDPIKILKTDSIWKVFQWTEEISVHFPDVPNSSKQKCIRQFNGYFYRIVEDCDMNNKASFSLNAIRENP